jgi:hypothetical protein
MNKIHNKEGPDYDVDCHVLRILPYEITKLAKDKNERRPRDGTERMPRDGTERMPRDGIRRMPRDGTQRMPRDGTDVKERMPRDGTEWLAGKVRGRIRRTGAERTARDGISGITNAVSNQKSGNTRILLKYLIIKPPGKGIFNRGKYFRGRNEIGGKPPLGCGEAELCPGVIGVKNDKFSKSLTLKIENEIVIITK